MAKSNWSLEGTWTEIRNKPFVPAVSERLMKRVEEVEAPCVRDMGYERNGSEKVERDDEPKSISGTRDRGEQLIYFQPKGSKSACLYSCFMQDRCHGIE